MRNQRAVVKARAKADIQDEFGSPDVVEKVKDDWLRLPATKRHGREAFMVFLEQYPGDLNDYAINELLGWEDFDLEKQPA